MNVLSLFPVLSSGSDKTSRRSAINWQLIHNLVESCLLEQWLNDEQLQTYTTSEYFSEGRADFSISVNEKQYSLSANASNLIMVRISKSQSLMLPVESGFCSIWRLQRPWLPLVVTQHPSEMGYRIISEPLELLELLLYLMDQSKLDQYGVAKLKESLLASQRAMLTSSNATLPLEVIQCSRWFDTLIAAEQWGALTDRPFHPLGKAKLGLKEREYQRYLAEFNHAVSLRWVAVAKSHLMVSDAVTHIESQQPSSFLLSAPESASLLKELHAKLLSETHVAIPLHPWQVDHVIPEFFTQELNDNTIVLLDFSQPETFASSSMRSMFTAQDTAHSIKLPMGVHALNSKRYLPALKLVNGEKNQRILEQALSKSSMLQQKLRLWDELTWWGFMEPQHVNDKRSVNPFFYKEPPTQLGAMLRTLPKDLCVDDIKLIPMASLGMRIHKNNQSHHLFEQMLKANKQACDHHNVKALFANLCDVFLGTMMQCLQMGFAPEMHGQNVVVTVQSGKFVSVLLRDHDSVRIHLPWLNAIGIDDPEYLSPPNFKNRLYRETPEALIFYLQSLGISVNIRAVVESLVEHFELAECELWQQVRHCIEFNLTSVEFTDAQRNVIGRELLERPDYPHKTLLLPVIERGADPHGSMPAGESVAVNPLWQCKTSEPAQNSAHNTRDDEVENDVLLNC